MALYARRDSADTSLCMNLRLGPIKRTAYFRTLLMSVGMLLTQRPPLLKVARL